MIFRVPKLASRILLFVMLATFLSPSLGWQMIASHEQLEHAGVSLAISDHANENDDHSDAHSSIGHVLTHMPIDLGATITIRPSLGKEPEPLSPQFSPRDTPPKAPFRPPRLLSLI
jgi:hypothetical protein